MEPDHSIDITNEHCPMTFVRTKLRLEAMKTGELLAVKLNAGEPMLNVPRAVIDHGHEILHSAKNEDGTFEILIKKTGIA